MNQPAILCTAVAAIFVVWAFFLWLTPTRFNNEKGEIVIKYVPKESLATGTISSGGGGGGTGRGYNDKSLSYSGTGGGEKKPKVGDTINGVYHGQGGGNGSINQKK